MLKLIRFIFFGLVFAAFISFTVVVPGPKGAITGKVKRTVSGQWACAVAGEADSIRGEISGGLFRVTGLKPGTYTLVIGDTDPGKQIVLPGVQVCEGELTNTGTLSYP